MNRVAIAILISVVILCPDVSEGENYLPQIETGRGAAGARDLPSLEKSSDISDYLRYAELNNPGLEAAFNRWKAAVEMVLQAGSLPDPKFTYSYFVQEVETRVGPQRHRFEIAQVFPWFGKLALREDAAAMAAEAARYDYEAARLRLFYRVKSAYYEYWYIGRAIAVTEKNLELLRDLEAVALAGYKAGKSPHAALVKVQLELGMVGDQLASLKDGLGPAAAEVNAALNRKLSERIQVPTSVPVEETVPDEEKLSQWLVSKSPRLKALAAIAAANEVSIKLARKSRYPDIMLGVGVVSTDEAEITGLDESGKDSIVAMVGLNLPLWYGKYRAAEREALARYDEAVGSREEMQNALLARFAKTFYGLRDARRKIDLYRDTLLPKARQSYEVTREAFRAGAVDFFSLMDAERLLLDFELSLARSSADVAQRSAELEMIVGKRIPREQNQKGEQR